MASYLQFLTYVIEILSSTQAIVEVAAIITAWKVSVFGLFLVRIRSECGKIRTRKTPNTDTFHAVSSYSIVGAFSFEEIFQFCKFFNPVYISIFVQIDLEVSNYFFTFRSNVQYKQFYNLWLKFETHAYD